ncbi:MAG: hypothetical protein M5U24_16435 [Candidatus Kuenenia sp.]|nr:hypothetical protein [Candidatus Kuenenia sp.]MCZ7624031.1 hypothetical protein [Candidatus Kuenenia sp.]
MIRLMVSISSGETDRLRYVMVVSIPETINHQEPERNFFSKKITAQRATLNYCHYCP